MRQLPQGDLPRPVPVVPALPILPLENARDRAVAWLDLLRRERRFIAGMVGATLAGLGVLLAFTTRQYTAEAQLLIQPDPAVALHLGAERKDRPNEDRKQFYETQYQLLRSRSLIEAVIERANLLSNPELVDPDDGEAKRAEDLLEDYRSDYLSVEPEVETQLVTLRLTLPDPELAAQVLSTHIEEYMAQELGRSSRATHDARSGLHAELGKLEQQLTVAEQKLNDYRRAHGILSFDDKENVVVDRLAELNRRLLRAQVARIERESRVALVEAGDLESLPAVLANDVVKSLKAQLATAQAEYALAGTHLKPTHPRVAELASQVRRLRSRLDAETTNIARGTARELQAAKAEEAALAAELENQRAVALEQKDTSIQYALLKREVDTTRELHNAVLEHMKHLGVAAQSRPWHVQVVDAPVPPTRPSYPRPLMTLALGGSLALFLALALAATREILRDRLRNPASVSATLGLQTLGAVPDFDALALPELDAGERKLIAHVSISDNLEGDVKLGPASDSVITEAYRSIRTSLLFGSGGAIPRTILFTSAQGNEGKTVTLLNTAIAFAQLGEPVLLIDADMRRPQCHQPLGIVNSRGLSDVLLGDAEPLAVLRRSSLGLSFMASGAMPPNTGALLGSREMAKLLETVRNHFAYVLIDGPPVLPVIDSIALSTLVDGVVLVVDQPRTPRGYVAAAQTRLRGVGANVIGCILNRVRPDAPDYAPYLSTYENG